MSTPKIIISDHYDKLVQQVDIHTEKLLERFTDNDLLWDHWNISGRDQEPLKDISEWDDGTISDWLKRYANEYDAANTQPTTPKIDLKSIKAKDYVNIVREEVLKAIEKAQQDSQDLYVKNKDKLKFDREKLQDPDELENFKRDLMSDKFCFILSKPNKYKETNISKMFFGLLVVITDFYLNQDQIEQIKERFATSNNSDNYKQKSADTGTDVDPDVFSDDDTQNDTHQKGRSNICSWMNLYFEDEAGPKYTPSKLLTEDIVMPIGITSCLLRTIISSNSDCYLINLTRKDIFEQSRRLSLTVRHPIKYLTQLCQMGFNSLTHLEIDGWITRRINPKTYCRKLLSIPYQGPVVQLDNLPSSLEYLKLKRIKFKNDSFPPLPNLRYLEFNDCQMLEKKKDWFNVKTFPVLRVLNIANDQRSKWRTNIDTLEVPSLTCLGFYEKYFSFKKLNKNLQAVELTLNAPYQLKDKVQFFNVRKLNLNECCKSELYLDFHFPNLNRLTLSNIQTFDVNFSHSNKLEYLIIDNSMKWDTSFSFDNLFSNLSQMNALKHLEVSFKDLKLASTNHVNVLSVVSLVIRASGNTEIDPNVFTNFPNLEILGVHLGKPFRFSKGLFSFVKKLKELDLKNFYPDSLTDDVFSELRSLITLRLTYDKIVEFGANMFDGLENLQFLFIKSPYDLLSRDSLTIFSPLKNLQKLELRGTLDREISKCDLIEFFANETQIMTVCYTVKSFDRLDCKRQIEVTDFRRNKRIKLF